MKPPLIPTPYLLGNLTYEDTGCSSAFIKKFIDAFQNQVSTNGIQISGQVKLDSNISQINDIT